MEIQSSQDLLNSTCTGLDDPQRLDDNDIVHLLNHLEHWDVAEDHTSIYRLFRFNNYYQTIAFVNAVAWVVHEQDHHPELQVGYNYCRVSFSTHSIKGLSIKDFICAARLDLLSLQSQ